MADNDFVRLNLGVGVRNVTLTSLGWEWPPPPFIHMQHHGGFTKLTEKMVEALPPSEESFVLIRLSMSEISDEDAEGMDRVARGAEYFYMQEQDAKPTS